MVSADIITRREKVIIRTAFYRVGGQNPWMAVLARASLSFWLKSGGFAQAGKPGGLFCNDGRWLTDMIYLALMLPGIKG